jgi:hypothetical protein
MPTEITGEEVKKACLAAGITNIDHHNCSMCGYMTRYFVEGEDLFFDAGCDCTRRQVCSRRSWQDAADWINLQTRDEIKQRISALFGIGATHAD